MIYCEIKEVTIFHTLGTITDEIDLADLHPAALRDPGCSRKHDLETQNCHGPVPVMSSGAVASCNMHVDALAAQFYVFALQVQTHTGRDYSATSLT